MSSPQSPGDRAGNRRPPLLLRPCRLHQHRGLQTRGGPAILRRDVALARSDRRRLRRRSRNFEVAWRTGSVLVVIRGRFARGPPKKDATSPTPSGDRFASLGSGGSIGIADERTVISVQAVAKLLKVHCRGGRAAHDVYCLCCSLCCRRSRWRTNGTRVRRASRPMGPSRSRRSSAGSSRASPYAGLTVATSPRATLPRRRCDRAGLAPLSSHPHRRQFWSVYVAQAALARGDLATA